MPGVLSVGAAAPRTGPNATRLSNSAVPTCESRITSPLGHEKLSHTDRRRRDFEAIVILSAASRMSVILLSQTIRRTRDRCARQPGPNPKQQERPCLDICHSVIHGTRATARQHTAGGSA